MLRIDKSVPQILSDVSSQRKVANVMLNMSKDESFPHLVLHGPDGNGKLLLARLFIKEVFGPKSTSMRIDERTFITPSSKKLEFSVFSSPFHIEILPTEMGNMDRLIIQDLVKEFSSSRQIIECSRPFKVVIVLDAGSLTRDAQQALRRTMEKSAKNVRFIFITDNTSKIIAPLRSRCMCFRCPVVPRSIVSSIIQNFKPIDEFGSLRRNLLVADSQTPRFWWEDTIGQLIEELKRKTNPGFCSEVRKLLSLIIVNSIPKKEFMKKFLLEYVKGRVADVGLITNIMQIYVRGYFHI